MFGCMDVGGFDGGEFGGGELGAEEVDWGFMLIQISSNNGIYILRSLLSFVIDKV